MAKLSSAKFSDKERAKSFRRSLSKRETRDEKEDQNDMNEIMKLLNLDKNFTIKFGLLKKACVLFFYARYNDAFD
jgi:predicted HTH transcriptional regulator